jgi:transposase-like protein
MHDNETKAKFIELRAKNWSYHRIADQLNISSGTAHAWGDEFSAEIQKLHAIEMEAIRERVLSSYEEDLTYLAEELKRVQKELRERDYGYCDTQQLFWYQGALMARIDKKCAPIEIPAPPKADDAKLNKTEQN